MDTLSCWRCGADLEDLPQPLSRRAECPACGAELHVCRMCRHFDPAKAKQCREPMADEVKNKQRANFCEWFQARPGPHSAEAKGGTDARGRLDALFGGGLAEDPQPDSSRSALDALFKKD